jgi:hypothetical protein
MVRDQEEAEAVLAESRSAMDALSRLIGRLEAFTERLNEALDRRGEEDADERQRG